MNLQVAVAPWPGPSDSPSPAPFIMSPVGRGNRRHQIFHSDRDRPAFLEILGETVDCHDWICHAYCLVGNHYHLMVETSLPTLSRGMRYLNGVHAQRHDAVHRKAGHLLPGLRVRTRVKQ